MLKSSGCAGAATIARSIAADALEAVSSRYLRHRCTRLGLPGSDVLRRHRHRLLESGARDPNTLEAAEHLNAAAAACEWAEQAAEAVRLLERRKWHKAAALLHKLYQQLEQHQLQAIPSELTAAIRNSISLLRGKCLARVSGQWRERLSWTEESDHVRLRIDICDRENLHEILNALFVSNRIDVEVGRFAHFFLKSIAPTLILWESSVVVREITAALQLEVRRGPRRTGPKHLAAVLDNLVLFFDTVHSNVECMWEDGRTVFSILGQIASDDFFKLLIDDYLEQHALAEESSPAIDKFSSYLCEIGFVQEDSNPLSKYVANRYNSMHEKSRETLLSDARYLMKIDLQKDVVKICDGQIFQVHANEIKMLEKEAHDRNPLYYPFLMSQCCISSSAKQLLELIFNELARIYSYPLKYVSAAVQTVKDVLTLYYTFVPQFHGESLKANALDLALFYNNSFYLTHSVTGHIWNESFNKEFATYVNAQLCDQMYNIRLSAIIKFSLFMKNQQLDIEKAIIQSDLNRFEKSNCFKTAGKVAISDCLNTFKKLQYRWQNILSVDHYEKALAQLIDCLSKELVQCLMTVKEDVIGEDLANDLSALFSLILNSVPDLFNENTNLKSLSRHYSRLSELTWLLKCPMFTIANQWKESDQLSKLFSSEEIKHFIRITFPGSIQKSTILNTIQ
ncbi:centromere/kinetochore protein zw10-like [Arctopsyche grandis]|uniref:centromere/kinetochore protein zw10-like n=1 Tax=Arctopsyche grandis TaxID=121162 RepID=UPI00406D9EC9